MSFRHISIYLLIFFNLPKLTWVVYFGIVVSLKQPIATKREVEVIERVQ